MKFTISGFGARQDEQKNEASAAEEMKQTFIPRKSLVQVHFPQDDKKLTYYNELFDLKPGDRVYVEGSREGQQGRVASVSYNFKIKLSDYKKVITLVDTRISGSLYMAGSHFAAFDPAVLPKEQLTLWFKAPAAEEEVICVTDDFSFPLEDLTAMHIPSAIAERGHNYYLDSRVRYLMLDNGRGYAVVEGSEAYTVEFLYRDGWIYDLVCDCPCPYTCKHAFAAMLQLQESLELIETHYGEEFHARNYFAAVAKGTFFRYAIDGKENGSFIL